MLDTSLVSQEEIDFLMEAGFIYRDAGRYEEAREVFTGVSLLRPNSEVPQVAIGTTLFVEGKLDECIEIYEEALKKNPESAYAYAHLGEAFFMKKEFDRAREALIRAVELDPEGAFGKMAEAILDVLP
ncbi:MAG: tetratricopeptide repeat protein [Acidobacteriota bacterium]|nr:tetratricopeptide repeat protein [Blastocatellia bacterium]MDW8411648.1 tetratricopeptide repeat protein [Acidobacteriota bacterium]